MPTGIATFCDDIRQEVGNKVSYIGVYNQALIIDAKFPITLPKLCIAVRFMVSKSEPLPERFSLSLKFAGAEKPIFETPVAALKPGASMDDTNTLGHAITGLMGSTHVVFSPLTVPEPSTLEVFLVTPDGSVEIGSLDILPAETPTE